MPKIFEWNGYRFFFYSNEGEPREPRHVHVRKGEQIAKFRIDPVSLSGSYEMSSSELRAIERVIEQNVELIRSKWDEFFRA
jgi:hypothetical protein